MKLHKGSEFTGSVVEDETGRAALAFERVAFASLARRVAMRAHRVAAPGRRAILLGDQRVHGYVVVAGRALRQASLLQPRETRGAPRAIRRPRAAARGAAFVTTDANSTVAVIPEGIQKENTFIKDRSRY